ncbi:PTS lactose/cellobiose transporter subunit IIA [Spiroplasma alleghenense]|uniref:PTS lactose/cellobiose transporter subunit IIA n=1 Tax=Spiroplasma alleghenense TaxID=216931 RepID=UPI000E1FA2B3
MNDEKTHSELIFYETKGEKNEISLLLIRSEDQLLSSQTIIALAKKMLRMYQKFNK